MKKKTLSLFLAFVLIVACMPVSARATASNDYTHSGNNMIRSGTNRRLGLHPNIRMRPIDG